MDVLGIKSVGEKRMNVEVLKRLKRYYTLSYTIQVIKNVIGKHQGNKRLTLR